MRCLTPVKKLSVRQIQEFVTLDYQHRRQHEEQEQVSVAPPLPLQL